MKTLAYYNGKITEVEDMMIPMNDRVCYFGDGVYDAEPAVNYEMFAIDEHIDRFFNSAGLLDIEMPLTKPELKALLIELAHKLDSGDLFVYFAVTRGTAPREHVFEGGPGNLWVMMRPEPVNEGQVPLKLITVEDTRFLHCNIKSLNLIPSVMAANKAAKAGCDEAVFYREGGRVTECAHSNVHIIRDGKLVTAPADNLILPGIARAHIIKACKKLSIPVNETPYTLEDLFNADEVLVSYSSAPCLNACEIDGKPVGGKDPELLNAIRGEVLNEFYEGIK